MTAAEALGHLDARLNNEYTAPHEFEAVDVLRSRLAALEKVAAAARAWTAARVRDGQLAGRSVIPTAQALLDALDELDKTGGAG